MNHSSAHLYEITQLTFRTTLSRGFRWIFFNAGWGLTLVAFTAGFLSLPWLWSRMGHDLSLKGNRISHLSLETKQLASSLEGLILRSLSQQEQLRDLRREFGLDARQTPAARGVFRLYLLHPQTGEAIPYFESGPR